MSLILCGRRWDSDLFGQSTMDSLSLSFAVVSWRRRFLFCLTGESATGSSPLNGSVLGIVTAWKASRTGGVSYSHGIPVSPAFCFKYWCDPPRGWSMARIVQHQRVTFPTDRTRRDTNYVDLRSCGLVTRTDSTESFILSKAPQLANGVITVIRP